MNAIKDAGGRVSDKVRFCAERVCPLEVSDHRFMPVFPSGVLVRSMPGCGMDLLCRSERAPRRAGN